MISTILRNGNFKLFEFNLKENSTNLKKGNLIFYYKQENTHFKGL